MPDRDMEDARRPKKGAQNSRCDGCYEVFDTDDLNRVELGVNREYILLCDDCYEKRSREKEDENNA